MRAQTRHQLKQDRFRGATIGAAEATVHWSVEHKTKLAIAAIVTLIVVAGATGGWYYINKQDEKASADLSRAVRALDIPLRPAGVPAVLRIQSAVNNLNFLNRVRVNRVRDRRI